MPELPEVETVRSTLKNHLIGRKIIKIITPYPNIIKVDLQTFKQKLLNQEFTDIKRYGKYLLFEFNDYTLVSHLRMEGKYFLRTSPKEFTKHEHVIFQLDNGLYLSYHDVRKFGTMEITRIGEEFNLESLYKLGVEVNEENIDVKKIYDLTKKSKRPIKAVLLDQTIITGLGNIYVDETLFRSKIHPATIADKISQLELKRILKNAKAVIDEAILQGGTTIRTYQSSLGVDGRFQNQLNVHTLVGEPCKVCGDKIQKIRVGGRGTYFCPTCQKRK
jgi:formamidopyrimidine-DNA glycosylase